MTDGTKPASAKRRPDGAAFVIAVVLAAIAGLIFWDVSRLAGAAGYSQVGPTTVPYAIACCLLGLAIWTAIEAWRGEFPERERQEVAPVVWIVAVDVLLLVLYHGDVIVYALIAFGVSFVLALAVLAASRGVRLRQERRA